MFQTICRIQARNPFLFQKCSRVTLTEEKYGCAKCQKIKKYTWRTGSRFSVSVINYGGIITNIFVPDLNGIVHDVVLGFDDIDSWVYRNTPYFGCTVGRCANLITNASFKLNEVEYRLPNNNGPHSLHGGLNGFDKEVRELSSCSEASEDEEEKIIRMIWTPRVEDTKLMLSYLSEDNEEGYPGDVVTTLCYEVTDDNTLHVDLTAISTRPTVVNLTNHSYFNLAGHDAGPMGLYDHFVTINADNITEGGNVKYVCRTPYDLRVARKLQDCTKQLLDLFDTNFCVNCYGKKDQVRFQARAHHAQSGRFMEVHSDAPGVQFYTGNFLPSGTDEEIKGKGSFLYHRHGGFCLQPQNFPDAINQPHFPSPILTPGDVYQRKIKYVFGVVESMQESPWKAAPAPTQIVTGIVPELVIPPAPAPVLAPVPAPVPAPAPALAPANAPVKKAIRRGRRRPSKT